MKRKIVIQRFVVLLSLILFATKIIAWRLTNSVTLFTDAMDSIVNVVAAVLGLASLYISSKPKDINHPLGHGKIEFLTSVAEGGMICGAGFIIIYESIQRIIVPSPIEKLDVGLIIIVIAGVLNYAIGLIACRYGEAKGSMVLISAGNHLKTDGYSAWGMVVGLLLLMFTGNRFYWLDSAVALVFAFLIIRTGFRVIKKSVSGIMDETNMDVLQEVVKLLQANRRHEWIDIHHLRVLNHSGQLHIDAHLTLPVYYLVSDAEKEIEHINRLIKANFGDDVEVFIHIEGCNAHECVHCSMGDCHIRHAAYIHRQEWTLDTIWKANKHAHG